MVRLEEEIHLRGGMVDPILDLSQRGARRILIETSGAATPPAIIRELEGADALRDKAFVAPCITVVDAAAYEDTRREFAAEMDAQLSVADLVIVNKRDKVDPDTLKQIAAACAERALPGARVVNAFECQVAVSVIQALAGAPSARGQVTDDDGAHDTEPLTTMVYRREGPVGSQVAFGHNLLNLPYSIVRAKGVVRTHSGPLLMSAVPGNLDWRPGDQSRADTCIAFIGRFDPVALERTVDWIYPLEEGADWDGGEGS